MVQETEYQFDDEHKSQKPKESAVAGLVKFIWNSETKEFCGRDGASWGKVSLFYAIFYACLGSFFIGMLAVFVAIMPKDKPTYYGESSTMSARGVNPGLGFRPQVDVEDSTIHFNPTVYEGKHGHKPFFRNLKNFLDAKYPEIKPEDQQNVIACKDGETYPSDLKNGKSCSYDYKTIFKNTPCTEEKKFGYDTNKPCVLLKLNKIISWTPLVNNGSIRIMCEGETSVDKDNLKGVTYHSEGHLDNKEAGYIDAKYFPFFAQNTYRAPIVFAQFDIKENTFVNVECKAFAENIDNKDRLNRRGQTKFGLFIEAKKN